MPKFTTTVTGCKNVVIGDRNSLTIDAGRTQRSQEERVFSQEDPGTRGTQRDRVSTESDSDPIFYSKPSLPADSDFLICFASAPGHESYREGSIGSWFICAIHKVFKEYAHKEHIMDMMLRVNNEVAGYLSPGGLKQMPCEICMLTKKVFFQQGPNVP
ncbi:Caspase-3 [Acropora cervicornis]|uniref:Caspase-3 n=1 Tax=Acropora cervicornis TaxID=6130 RepID=A0AAD9R2B2_ACRCE|nr:Caspase-3 [Acropora cervicornis]